MPSEHLLLNPTVRLLNQHCSFLQALPLNTAVSEGRSSDHLSRWVHAVQDEGFDPPLVWTPWLRKACSSPKEPPKRLVQVWHDKTPTFGIHGLKKEYSRQDFVHQATFVVDGTSADDVMEDAYVASQNIDYNWNPLGQSRSSSVGDVFVLLAQDKADVACVVQTLGFAPVKFK